MFVVAEADEGGLLVRIGGLAFAFAYRPALNFRPGLGIHVRYVYISLSIEVHVRVRVFVVVVIPA
jgi:hypothetical protein